MTTPLFDRVKISAQSVSPDKSGGYLVSGSPVIVNLPSRPRLFFRHGWQSWSLAAWIDPTTPPVPIRAAEFRTKDEDPVYAFADRHVSAWVGAAETLTGQVILLGALGLAGRVELDGDRLRGFYETGSGEWFVGAGEESQVFSRYVKLLGERLGGGRFNIPPRVWCSWYSLYNRIDETVISNILEGIGDLPFDVFQLDDGWQVRTGDWEANSKFPSGMAALADKIRGTGRTPGIWLAPLMVHPAASIVEEHKDWLLRDETGNPVRVGPTWGGNPLALDVTHPGVQEWLGALIRKVCGWGYGYLKLDFLYAGALPGKQHTNIPREAAYRDALGVMRQAAGEAYLLACGAPVIPSLGLCDGLRVGPDVTPFWLNTPLSTYLNNPNHPSTQNAIRTSLNRLWLAPLVHIDPDVIYFRSRHNALKPREKALLRDLGLISGFKANSDLPGWLKPAEHNALREFLEAHPAVTRQGRTQFRIDDREIDFAPAIRLPRPTRFPTFLAKYLGLINLGIYEMLPAILEIRKNRRSTGQKKQSK